MKLRDKVLFAIILTWVVLFSITYIGSRVFLLHNYSQLEKKVAETEMDRALGGIHQMLSSLQTLANDWSTWDDAYLFAANQNPTFITANLTPEFFSNTHTNLIIMYDAAGKIIYERAVNLDDKVKNTALPRGLNTYLTPESPLINHTSLDSKVDGLVNTASGIMLIASRPILTSTQQGPSKGTLIMGRYFADKELQEIAEATKLDLTLYPSSQIKQSPLLENLLKDASNNSDKLLQHVDDTENNEYVVLKDINAEPIGMLRIKTKRIIYQSGLSTIYFYLFILLIFTVISALLLWRLLRALVVQRLEQFNNEILNISSGKKFSQRITVNGHDEISSVAKEVNTMLDVIEHSHDSLELRVQERTRALQQSNLKLKTEVTQHETTTKKLQTHQEHLGYMAHFDALTALPNRLLFNDTLNKAILRARANNQFLAILFVDVDRFKQINETLSHYEGDKVLRLISERLKKSLRSEDTVARLGGDEFIILLPDLVSMDPIYAIGQKILHLFTDPLTINNRDFYLNASIGISVFPHDGESLEVLQKNADLAMYRAKKAGGGIFHFYTEEMAQWSHRKVELESRFRKALANHEFMVYFQPKIDLHTKKIVGCEALARWHDAENGFVPPTEFIPMAEETGLITPLGEFILGEVCKTNKAWQDQGYQRIPISVNLSPVQFRNKHLVESISQVLTETGLEAQYLELEITESAVMENVPDAIHKLNEIRALGISISVDDFGTGYSSISNLKQFPVSILKIDRSFIKGIPANHDDLMITNSVIALAHSLGFKVVAEGVETIEQSEYLTEHQCDMAQGYFYSRPLPAQKIVLQLTKATKQGIA